MWILALDTTTRGGSAAVLRDDAIVALVEGDAARTHAERLPAELAEALRTAHLSPGDIDLLAVASGPGGFTGLRIGLAAMQGLALTLRKPVIGVSSLDAMAASAAGVLGHGSRESPAFIGCWIDAQRGEVFAALYSHRLAMVGEPGVATPAATLNRWRPLLASSAGPVAVAGDGAARYADAVTGAGHRVIAAPPLAPLVGRIARARAAAGETGSPHALAPLYVRRPDAELDRERRSPA